MTSTDIQVLIVLVTGVTYSLVTHKLNVWGALAGGLVGWLIFKGIGFTGLGMLITFFISASLATSWQADKKRKFKIPGDGLARNAGQVLANGGVAAILGFIAWLHPSAVHFIQLAIAGSLASATGDTLSSELGSVYGRKFYDVLTFERSIPGPDGIVSFAGLLAGVFGTVLIAVAYAIGAGFTHGLIWIVVAGITGNLFDSVLGASLERKGFIGNDIVNFLNTTMGAAVCTSLAYLFR